MTNDADNGEAGPVWVTVDVLGPASVGPGEDVSLRAVATNVSGEAARGVRLEVREEEGAGFVGSAAYPLPDIDPGQKIEIEMRGQVNAKPGEDLHVIVRVAGGNLSLEADAAYTAIVRQDEAEAWQPGPGAGMWRTSYGHLEVILPVDRDERITKLRQRGLYGSGDKGQGLLYRFELEAEDVSGQTMESFDSPITLRWRYAEALAEHPPLVPPLFAWWNPATELWEPLPTRADVKSGVIETEVSHFSTFGTLLGIHEGAEDPFSGLDADAFTGSLSYRFPLPLLTRPGGFAPALALNYNSRRRDAQQSYGSADSPIGFGWRLDGIDSINYVDAQPTYALSLGGATYTVRRAADYTWYALEAPAIRITRASSDEDAVWYVYTPDGARYAFSKVQEYVRCDANQVFVKGKTFMLSSITAAADNDVFSYSVNLTYNTISDVIYTRTVDFDCGGVTQSKSYVFQALPGQMTFSGIGGHSASVDFIYAARTDLPAACQSVDCNDPDNDLKEQWYYSTRSLQDVTLKVDGQVARGYHLTTEIKQPSGDPRTHRLLLKGVQVFGQGGVTALPATTFAYEPESACQEAGNCRLTQIDSGQGGTATLSYEVENSSGIPYWAYKLKTLTLTDAVAGGNRAANYWYSGWSQDASGYNFAIITHPGDDQAGVSDDLQDKHWFYTTDPSKGKWGLEYQTAHNDGAGKLFDLWQQTFVEPPLPPGLGYANVRWLLQDATNFLYDSNGAGSQRISRKNYTYALDHQNNVQGGNVTHLREYGATDADLIRTTERWYYPGAAIKNRMAEEKVYQGDVGGACKSHRRWYYDGQAGHQSPPTKGLLTKVEAARDACGGGFVTQVQNSYDPTWHNLTRSQDGLGRGVTTTYESEFHVFVSTQTNDLNQTTTTAYPGTDVVKRALGLPSQVTDANQQVTSFAYDGFGRPLTANRPLGHASVDEQWVYTDYSSATSPRQVLHKVYDEVTAPANPESGYLAAWTFYDGLGRVVQTQSEKEDGNGWRIVVSQQYGARGQLRRQGVSYNENVAPGAYKSENWTSTPPANTFYEYDALGRAIRVTSPDASVVRNDYNYLQTAARDALNRQTISVVDALGRTISVKQYEGSYAGGPNWTATVYAEAKYEYDALDRLEQVVGPDGAVVDPTYNLLGQKTAMSDPDLGAWSYGYDAAGNLTRQTDARGKTLCYEYDALNRLRYVREDQTAPQDCTGALVWRTTHEYDTLNWQPVTNGIGRRNRLNDGSGTTTWAYDARGRMTQETKVINNPGGGTFVTQWTYDAADRVKTMTYPGGNTGGSGEVVVYGYNPQGLLEQMVRSSPTPTYYYVGGTDYNALGQVELRKLGSTAGVLTTDYMYRSDNYRLQWIKTGKTDPYEGLQKLEYAYDAVGNVDWSKDYKAPDSVQTLDFTYDALNRLTHGVSSGSSSGAYNESYGYADNQGGKAGNLTSKTGLGNYTYGAQAAGCPEGALSKPHAVVTAGSYTYCYDQNGNMRQRTMGSNTYTLTYDAENRLTGVSGAATATFVYDGDGKRVKVTAGGVTTAYVGEHYEWTGSTSTSKKYYYADGARIAMRVGGTLSWLLADHLGSTAVTANSTGGESGKLLYKPWGETRYSSGSTPTSYRFTGQREDATIGLYYYGARYYDPALGRFVQADTIVPEPGNPQALNRYTSVLNNPIKYTDPSGHAECASEDCVVRVHPKTKQPLGMRQKWGIVMVGPWEAEKAWMVYEGMNTISERVGEQLGDAQQGDRWIRSSLGGTEHVRWPNKQKPPHPILVITSIHTLINGITGGKTPWQGGPTGLALPAHYPLLNNDADTIYFFDPMDQTTPVHESGHIIDYRNDYISSDMAKLVPRNESPTNYGTTNQIEDFAESWMYWIYKKPGLTNDRQTFIESLVVQWR